MRDIQKFLLDFTKDQTRGRDCFVCWSPTLIVIRVQNFGRPKIQNVKILQPRTDSPSTKDETDSCPGRTTDGQHLTLLRHTEFSLDPPTPSSFSSVSF